MKTVRVILLVSLVVGLTLAVQTSVFAQGPIEEVPPPGPGPGPGGPPIEEVPPPGSSFSCRDFSAAGSISHSATGFAVGAYANFEPGLYTFDFELGTATAATVRLVSEGFATVAGPAAVPTMLSYDMTGVSQPNWLYVVVDSVSPTESSIVISPSCGGAGCNSLVPIPEQAVVGQFNWDSELYWKPGEQVSPTLTVEAGKTYWVAGQDASEDFYKVLIACDWLWVRKGTVGPNYDAVWNGALLPNDIVE